MRFCLLEQSGRVPDALFRARRAACIAQSWGHYRLNWNPSTWEYEDADVLRYRNVTWAQGRSLLFDEARLASYEYYLFVDDDVLLAPREDSVSSGVDATGLGPGEPSVARLAEALRVIADSWTRWKPVSGTIFSRTDWGVAGTTRLLELACESDAFAVSCHDLQTHFFRRDFAELVFPAPLKGSGASMWYAQFVGAYGWPSAQLCLTGAWARNTRAEPHRDFEVPGYLEPRQLHEALRSCVKHANWDAWAPDVLPLGLGQAFNAEASEISPTSGTTSTQVSDAWRSLIDTPSLAQLRSRTWSTGPGQEAAKGARLGSLDTRRRSGP
jgi:hypothetical protein